MASTPSPNPQHLSLKSKLPVKRKIPDPNPNLAPKLDGGVGGDRSQPPFKFHRIWTEPDEIRFLQHLLDSSANLSVPKDLNLFYSTFSRTTSHPYTKSQLYEKLRRLRKKFRVVSARLARGLHRAMLSPHERQLFDLSKRLWGGPDSSDTSPFGGGGGCGGGGNSMQKNSMFNLVGVEVSFSPTLDINNHTVLNRIGGDDDDDQILEDNQVIDGGSIFVDNYSDAKLSEVNVELDNAVVAEQKLAMPIGGGGGGGGIGEVVARTVMNVFDQSLEEVRTVLVSDRGSDQPVVDDLEKRWREQRVAELDVLGRRLRLVLEHALQKQ
ncbi:hypothetical protein Vadar_000091 [Vaccinium darrowii]|uniref:Uncharacterized protein n=1 Tax=Vaccinium darrowii TaxID=229202 RepID=A0ACB7Z0W3_9ERIC|nr:hypothetical protein Vadar_000091 [Vaccinium darrowii]